MPLRRRYLDDPIIKEKLSDLDKVVEQYILARINEDYATISFCLGGIFGIAQVIYGRNAEIEGGDDASETPDP